MIIREAHTNCRKFLKTLRAARELRLIERINMGEVEKYYALTERAFNVLAPVYNWMTLPLVRVRDQVVDIVNKVDGSTVLDVATGTGQQAFAFAKRGYSVIGMDINKSMLEIARKHNKDNLVNFQIGDATRLGFENNTFDITCISFALHDMPLLIRQKVLQEMARVAKPDGVIIIVEYDLPKNKVGRALMYRLITLYESEYYKQFIASDLETLLGKTGIKITVKRSALLGGVRILTGGKANPSG